MDVVRVDRSTQQNDIQVRFTSTHDPVLGSCGITVYAATRHSLATRSGLVEGNSCSFMEIPSDWMLGTA